jgi:Uma2 family endonuclease
MATVSRHTTYTFDDFCFLETRKTHKADLIDGVIYVTPPDALDENRLCQWLADVLGDFVARKDLGKVFVSRVVFRLDDRNGLEPDIACVRKEHLNLLQRRYIDGPPDLAVEIVSPESVERDYEKKRQLYERAGVTEYWILDEYLKKVTMLHLDRKGTYHGTRPRNGELHSLILPGFWLRPEWLWEETRPGKDEVLRQLLA